MVGKAGKVRQASFVILEWRLGVGKVSKGRLVQIMGPVVDVEFPPEGLPEIYDAVEVQRPAGGQVMLEVQQDLGNNWVRCVAMDSTDGLRRGLEAVALGGPITVPVGRPCLGRLLNVIGDRKSVV